MDFVFSPLSDPLSNFLVEWRLYFNLKRADQAEDQLVKNQNEIIEEQQEDFKKQFLKQEAYIKDSLEQRDKTLISTLREMQESQKEIAASLSEEKNKKKWWQLWLR